MRKDNRRLRHFIKIDFFSLNFYLCFLLLLCVIGFLYEDTRSQDFQYRTEYGYDGEFGRFGIADTAACYDRGTLIGKAKAIRIIKKSPGPNDIEVKETHYDTTGSLTYEGTIVFKFGFGGGDIVSETAISGRKRRQVFTEWPAGH